MRRLGLLTLLLLIIADSTLGQEPTEAKPKTTKQQRQDKDRSADEIQDKDDRLENGCETCCATAPCHCIQELWLDFGGPSDIYICTTHETQDCNVYEEELWYGNPAFDELPQQCEPGYCEVYEGDFRRYDIEKPKLPGHEEPLNEEQAEDLIRFSIDRAKRKNPSLDADLSELAYHVIPKEWLPDSMPDEDITILALPITIDDADSPLNGETFYYCMQINTARTTEITVLDVTQGTGRQMRLTYEVDGEERKGLIWLRDPK